MVTKVTSKNQATVPSVVAVAEGIKPGTRLAWSFTEREHVLEVRVLTSVAEVAANLRGRGVRYRSRPGSAVDALLREREREERNDGEDESR